MKRPIAFRLGELFGPGGDGCGYLDPHEIERWADGTLAPDRRDAFERHADGCTACGELRDDLALFSAAEADAGKERPPRVRRSRLLPLGAAAAVAAAAALAVVLLRPAAPLVEDPGTLPFVPPPAVRGRAADWSEAEAAWRRGAPGEAAARLESLVERAPGDADAWYHLGVARLAAGNAGAAVDAFRRADALQGASPSESTRWGLAVALDRAGRRDEACAALRAVAALDGGRAAQARGIVDASCPPSPTPR